MAFKVLNNVVITNTSDVTNTTIDTTNVLDGVIVVSDGTNSTSINRGQTLTFSGTSATSVTESNGVISIDASGEVPTNISAFVNDVGYITTDADNQTLSFVSPDLTISNGNSVDLSTLQTDLTGYATEAYADQAEADAISSANIYTDFRDATLIGDSTVNGTIGNTIKNRIDDAEADAITSANAYTDSIVASSVTGDSNRVVYDLANPASSIVLDPGTMPNTATYYGDVVDSNGNVIVDVSSTSTTFTGGLIGNVYGDLCDPTGVYKIVETGTGSNDSQIDIYTANITDLNASGITSISGNATFTGGSVDFTGTTTMGSWNGPVYDRTGGTLIIEDDATPNPIVHADLDGDVTGQVSDISNHLTTNLVEGTNLYYTDARVNTLLATKNYATETYTDQAESDAISTSSADATSKADQAEADAIASAEAKDVVRAATASSDATSKANAAQATAISTASSDATSKANTALVDAKAYADALDTSDISENGPLYFTNERVDDRVSNLLVAGSNITLTYNDSLNTMTIASATTASGGYDLSSNTTDDVTEGATNLYFTSARVNTILTTGSYANETYVDNAVANVVDSAPGTLDTLNELAAALGDDPNFATTITNQIAAKANTADLATVATSGSYTDLSNKPTIPTNNNQLTNGAGYITSFTDTNDFVDSLAFNTTNGILTVGRSGALNDLTVDLDGRYLTSSFSTENIQDIVGDMVSSNTESGISVTYDDTNGKLNFNVADPTISLTGDVTGSATMTNLGNVSITATVANNSHTHSIANVTGLQTALDGKVDDSQVLTNVPAGAVFTDTNTQRAIHDTPVNGATTTSISSNWAFDNVKTAVPAGAVFTDTNTNNYISGATFSTANGILTLARSGLSSLTVDLDGRFTDNVYADTMNQNVRTTDSPSFAKIRATNSTDASLTSTGHAFQTGATSGQNIIIDTNEIMARDNGATGNLHLQGDGGLATFGNNTTNKVHIDAGAITATGDITAYGTISDIRQKENIERLENALDKVNQLNGYTFNYINHEDRMTGVMAQEVQSVLPEAVFETNKVETDDGVDHILAVRHGNMVGLLIEAIKEQQTQIEMLKQEVDNLKNKV